jgi:hypothetical protein
VDGGGKIQHKENVQHCWVVCPSALGLATIGEYGGERHWREEILDCARE